MNEETSKDPDSSRQDTVTPGQAQEREALRALLDEVFDDIEHVVNGNEGWIDRDMLERYRGDAAAYLAKPHWTERLGPVVACEHDAAHPSSASASQVRRHEAQAAPASGLDASAILADRDHLREALRRITLGTAGDPAVAADKALTASRQEHAVLATAVNAALAAADRRIEQAAGIARAATQKVIDARRDLEEARAAASRTMSLVPLGRPASPDECEQIRRELRTIVTGRPS